MLVVNMLSNALKVNALAASRFCRSESIAFADRLSFGRTGSDDAVAHRTGHDRLGTRQQADVPPVPGYVFLPPHACSSRSRLFRTRAQRRSVRSVVKFYRGETVVGISKLPLVTLKKFQVRPHLRFTNFFGLTVEKRNIYCFLKTMIQ